MELSAAFEAASPGICELVPPGEPLEIEGFTPFLTASDRPKPGRIPDPSSRRQTASIGLEIRSADRTGLPRLSGGEILSYLADHYVSVQARVKRDAATGDLYLHHRPLAATARYGAPRLTQETVGAVAAAIRNFRGLGLWLGEGEPAVPRNMRTLVLLHRFETDRSPAGSFSRPQVSHEFLFVRARPTGGSEDGRFELHVFATTQDRRVLHELTAESDPGGPDACAVRAAVRFTEFSHGGFYPTEAVVTDFRLRSAADFPLDRLDREAAGRGWEGGAFANLSTLLDAIIDGTLRPESSDKGA